MPSAQPPNSSIAPLLLVLIAAAISAGLSAVWAGAAVMSASNASWMAIVAALDAALLLRLAGMPGGRTRVGYALLITLATVALGAALVASAKVGLGLGFKPAEALSRMSLELIGLYVQANSGWIDLAWLAGAALVAWWTAR